MSNYDVENSMVEVCGYPSDRKVEQVGFLGGKKIIYSPYKHNK